MRLLARVATRSLDFLHVDRRRFRGRRICRVKSRPSSTISSCTRRPSGLKWSGSAGGQAEPVYRLESELPLIPASNLKLITTSAALDRLGPDFRFRTLLFATAKTWS